MEEQIAYSLSDNTEMTDLTDEEILSSYENADFSRTVTEVDTNETASENKETICEASTLWQLPLNTVISSSGRKLVGKDPNISSETLKRLIVTEAKYLSEEDRTRFSQCSKENIANEEFYMYKSVGEAHLSQCIRENMNKPLASLIYTYSDDRRIPFILGALYIDAFRSCYRLFYYDYSAALGYRKIAWEPETVYIPPTSIVPPPPKKKNFKKYYDPAKIPVYSLPDCPVCGSPVKMLRAGYRSKLWHVCCTDQTEQCELFIGIKPSATEQDAVNKWKEFCTQYEKNKGKDITI